MQHRFMAVTVLAVSTAQADVIYVDVANCPGPGDGSEADPYCSIQMAIDNAAMAGDEIIVAPGTYVENINLLGKAIWLHSSDGADATTIESATGFEVVICESGEGADTVLEGLALDGIATVGGFTFGTMINFNSSPTVIHCTLMPGFDVPAMYNDGGDPTVTDCTFIGEGPFICTGAGMLNTNSDPTLTNCTFTWLCGFGIRNMSSNPTVTDCTFSVNIAGPPMFNYDSSPTVTGCVFTDNFYLGGCEFGCSGSGGGMLNHEGSSPTVIGCDFIGNFAGFAGGGMSNIDSSPTVIDCMFSENTAGTAGFNSPGRGGGMYNEDSNPTVTGCTFSENTANPGSTTPGRGGGMYNDASTSMLRECIFTLNSAGSGGGAYSAGSIATLTDCAFVANSATAFGGGTYSNNSIAAMTNSIFALNSADSGGGMSIVTSAQTVSNCTFGGNLAVNGHALAFDSLGQNLPSDLIMTNCLLWDGGSEISNSDASNISLTYSNVQGGWPGTGNIDADPLFVDPDNGDFRLSPNSPCIDAGDNAAVPDGIDTDLDGNPRFVDDPQTDDTGFGDPPIVDMGAYEFQPCIGDLNGDGNVFVIDLLLLLMDFGSCDDSPADLDGDGCVGIVDLLTLIANFGPCSIECLSDAGCDDANPCTIDLCIGGKCYHVPIGGPNCGG